MLLWRSGSPGIPARIADQLGCDIKRVFLVANNRHLAPSNLPDDLGAHDLVVQFNSCIHIAHFLSADCSKLFVFRARGNRRVNFGYPPNPNAFVGIDPALFHGQLYVSFVDNIPAPSYAPAVLQGIIRDTSAVGYLNSFRGIFKSYPKPPKIDFAGPSTGFVTIRLFLEARRRLAQHVGSKLEIILLGFEDTPNGTFWRGHNWAFERSFVEAHRLELTLSTTHK